MSTYHCAKRTFDLRIRVEIYLEVPNLRINYFFLGLKETSKLTEINPSIHKKLRHCDSNNSSSKHLNQTKECSGIIHRCSLQIVWQVSSKQKSFTIQFVFQNSSQLKSRNNFIFVFKKAPLMVLREYQFVMVLKNQREFLQKIFKYHYLKRTGFFFLFIREFSINHWV